MKAVLAMALAVFFAGMTAATTALAFDKPQIPYNPQCYRCVRADKAPLIDGQLEDAAWQRAEWTEDFADIRGGAEPAPRYRTHAKLVWDDKYLYIAAELVEPHLQASFTRRDSYIYQRDNDFEVFLDPDGDGHQYYELELNAFNTAWDLLLVKPYRDGGPALNGFDLPGLHSAVFQNGSINEPEDTDIGWCVEVALPWTSLAEMAGVACPPVPGDFWRLNFSRVEWQFDVREGKYVQRTEPTTGALLPEDNWVWSPPGLIAMHYPELWGYIVFCTGDEAKTGDPRYLIEELAKHALYEFYYAQQEYHETHGIYAAELKTLQPYLPQAALTDALPWFEYLAQIKLSATPQQYTARIKTDGASYVELTQDGRCTTELMIER